MDDGPVQVYSAANSIEATLVTQLLENAGIQARIASNALEMVSGKVPFQLVSVPIWVKRSQFDEAQRVIQEQKTFAEANKRTPET